jgi:hypothetical protein
MPKKNWKIDFADGGNSASDLVGCRIRQTDNGYDFTNKNRELLASTHDAGLPFSFVDFPYDNHTWTVTVLSLDNPATGGWKNNVKGTQGEEGSWSAGATMDEDQDEDAAAAAP